MKIARDIRLFLVLIPFISAFNYYLTYSSILWNWYTLFTFTIDTLQGYAAWWGVRMLINYLDKKLPIEGNEYRRITIQLITTTLLGLTIISLLTEITSWIVRGRPAITSFYTVYLFIIAIWFLAINAIYIGFYYYDLSKGLSKKATDEIPRAPYGLMARHGKQETKLLFTELEGFCVEGEYVAAVHDSGKKYYLDQSLDQIEKLIPGTEFFRLNRQVILRRDVITGYKRLDYGKVLVQTRNEQLFPAEIIVSRIKSPAFKDWFREK